MGFGTSVLDEREKGDIGGEDANFVDAEFDGLTATMENDGASRFNPLLHVGGGKSYEIRDRGLEEIKIGLQDS
jgi:hypothetical protein